MAQHIPIKCFKQKVFRRIEENIKKFFNNSNGAHCSFKYEWDKTISNHHKQNDNDEVYLCTRYIGKGFVHGDTRGSFEIHFDRVKKEVTEIYLVA